MEMRWYQPISTSIAIVNEVHTEWTRKTEEAENWKWNCQATELKCKFKVMPHIWERKCRVDRRKYSREKTSSHREFYEIDEGVISPIFTPLPPSKIFGELYLNLLGFFAELRTYFWSSNLVPQESPPKITRVRAILPYKKWRVSFCLTLSKIRVLLSFPSISFVYNWEAHPKFHAGNIQHIQCPNEKRTK